MDVPSRNERLHCLQQQTMRNIKIYKLGAKSRESNASIPSSRRRGPSTKEELRKGEGQENMSRTK